MLKVVLFLLVALVASNYSQQIPAVCNPAIGCGVGGTCQLFQQFNGFYCVCSANFVPTTVFPSTCVALNPCLSSPCGGYQCINTGNGGYRCNFSYNNFFNSYLQYKFWDEIYDD